MKNKVFVVDLDGCLSKSDILEESVIRNILIHPLWFFVCVCYLFKGKVKFKKMVYDHFGFQANDLVYNQDVIELCKVKLENDYKLVLCTGSLQSIADKVQDELKLFDYVIGTSDVNNTSNNKLELIERLYGDCIVEYIGNSKDDIPLFSRYNNSYITNYKKCLLPTIEKYSLNVIGDPAGSVNDYIKTLRVHQWSKNLLIFVAILTSHLYLDFQSVLYSVVAFFSLSFCASSHYIVNDILDISQDRIHRTKQYRGIPSGKVSLVNSLLLSIAMLVASLILAYSVSTKLFFVVVAYFILTNVYSFFLKKKLVIDVICLAILFTIRILCGAIAIDVVLSPWLLITSIFFFLSLALLKRKIELSHMIGEIDRAVPGRAYIAQDLGIINNLGVSSGLISCLVFTLFISANQSGVYSNEGEVLLWCITPVIIYWISYVWILSERLLINDDPIKFAIKDRKSLIVFSIITILFLTASKI